LLNFKDGVAKTMMDNLLEDIERQRSRDIALKTWQRKDSGKHKTLFNHHPE